MKVLAVHHEVPTRRVTNADILDELRARGGGHLHPHDLTQVEASVTRFLETAGTDVRYILGPGERALDLVLEVAKRAGLAAFTVGEAASATVVASGPETPWHFTFRNFSDPYDVCLLPLDTYDQFTLRPTDPRCVPGRFSAQSRELIPAVVRRIVEVFEA